MALIQFVFVFKKYKITNVIQESKVRIKREKLRQPRLIHRA